jgi:hypothetical protein
MVKCWDVTLTQISKKTRKKAQQTLGFFACCEDLRRTRTSNPMTYFQNFETAAKRISPLAIWP